MQDKTSVHLKPFDKLLLGAVIFIFLTFCISSFVLGHATFVDVLRGYVSMEQFFDGGCFNTLNYQLSSEEVSYFVAWWTPGQYILPYALHGLGLSLQAAESILISVFLLISIVGYLRLFRFFNFSPTISLLSILLILTNHLFFWNSLMYFGGSLFEMALLPWFILFLLKIERFSWKTSLAYLVFALILFFLKATFLIHAGIGLGVLLLGYKTMQKKELLMIVLTGISIASICYFSFLQFGETPSSAIDAGNYNSVSNNFINDIFTPFASITGIPFIIGIWFQKLGAYYDWIAYLGYLIFPALALITLWLFREMARRSRNQKKLVVITLTFLVLFVLFYLTNKAISYDFRHFAPLAFIFIPFLLQKIIALRVKQVFIFNTIRLIIGLNLLSFGLIRFAVWSELNFVNQFPYTSPEVEMINMLELNEGKKRIIHSDTRVILVNNWNGIIYFLDNKVIPIYNDGESWYLNSGMELENAKKIDLKKELDTKENTVILGNQKFMQSILLNIDTSKYELSTFSRTHFLLYSRR